MPYNSLPGLMLKSKHSLRSSGFPIGGHNKPYHGLLLLITFQQLSKQHSCFTVGCKDAFITFQVYMICTNQVKTKSLSIQSNAYQLSLKVLG